MGTSVKTDNSALPAKLALRRAFLTKYHQEVPPIVLDCCQGSGTIWGALKQEYALANYCGFDVKPKKGRLKIESHRFLAAGGWVADVLDVDTYGSPWKHWVQILTHGQGCLTVFLTIGFVAMGGGNVDTIALTASGLTFHTLTLPGSLKGKVHELTVPHTLMLAENFGWTIIECLEAESRGSARYVGIRLCKKPLDNAAPPL